MLNVLAPQNVHHAVQGKQSPFFLVCNNNNNNKRRYFSLSGDSVCSACPGGTFSEETGNSICLECSPSTYVVEFENLPFITHFTKYTLEHIRTQVRKSW